MQRISKQELSLVRARLSRLRSLRALAVFSAMSSAVTGLIEREQANELPLNGRNRASLTAFVPSAIDTGGSNQRMIRFAGRGLDDGNFTYAGVDTTNIVKLEFQGVLDNPRLPTGNGRRIKSCIPLRTRIMPEYRRSRIS